MHKLSTISKPNCVSNPIYTCSQWWSTLLYAPQMPVAVHLGTCYPGPYSSPPKNLYGFTK